MNKANKCPYAKRALLNEVQFYFIKYKSSPMKDAFKYPNKMSEVLTSSNFDMVELFPIRIAFYII